MAATPVTTSEHEYAPTLRERMVDTVRDAARLPKEARLPTSVEEAVQDAVHATRRAITLGRRRVSDFKDDAVYRVKRQPLQVVSGAFGLGLALGVAVGWLASRRGRVD